MATVRPPPSAQEDRDVPRPRSPCKNAERSLRAPGRRPARCPRRPSSRIARGPGSARWTRHPTGLQRSASSVPSSSSKPPPAPGKVLAALARGTSRNPRRPGCGPAGLARVGSRPGERAPAAGCFPQRRSGGPSSANCSSASRRPGPPRPPARGALAPHRPGRLGAAAGYPGSSRGGARCAGLELARPSRAFCTGRQRATRTVLNDQQGHSRLLECLRGWHG